MGSIVITSKGPIDSDLLRAEDTIKTIDNVRIVITRWYLGDELVRNDVASSELNASLKYRIPSGPRITVDRVPVNKSQLENVLSRDDNTELSLVETTKGLVEYNSLKVENKVVMDENSRSVATEWYKDDELVRRDVAVSILGGIELSGEQGD